MQNGVTRNIAESKRHQMKEVVERILGKGKSGIPYMQQHLETKKAQRQKDGVRGSPEVCRGKTH